MPPADDMIPLHGDVTTHHRLDAVAEPAHREDGRRAAAEAGQHDPQREHEARLESHL